MIKRVIQSIHIYTLLIISTGFSVHIFLHAILLGSSKRDAWLSVFAASVPFILWTLLVYHLFKKMEMKHVFARLFALPSWISYGLCSLFGCFFFLTAFNTFQYTLYWAKINYAPDIPNVFLVLSFAALCYYASYKGIRTMSALALFLLPIVMFFGVFVGVGNKKYKDYSLLFPVFEYGYEGFLKGIVYSCAGLFEIIIVLFLTPYMKGEMKRSQFLGVAMLLVGLAAGPLMGSISVLGAEEAANLLVPSNDLWKMLTIGTHITRLDFMSTFQWFSGAYIRVALSMFVVNQLFSHLKKRSWVLPSLYALLIISVLIPSSSSSFYAYMSKVYYPVCLVFFICTAGILLLLSRNKGDAS